MSFSFGTPKTTGGLTFGTAAPGTVKPAGFSFGSPAAAPTVAPAFGTPPANTGFSFGTPQAAPASASPFGGGLTFGAPAATQSSGFSFTAPQPSQNQSPFGITSPTAQPTNLAPQQNVTTPALSFGQPPAATSAFSFAAKPATTAPTATIKWGGSPGMSFGQTQALPPATAPIGGLNFGAPASTAAPSFGFGSSPAPSFGQSPASAQTSAATLNFGQTNPAPIKFGQATTTTAAAPGLSFGLPQAASTAAPSLGFGVPATSTVLSFGQTPATSVTSHVPATSQLPTTGFSLSGTQQMTATSNIGLNLAPPVQPIAPPTSAPTQSAPAFGVSPVSTGFSLSSAAPSTNLSAPISSAATTTLTGGTGFTGFQMPTSQPAAQSKPANTSLPSLIPASLPTSTAVSSAPLPSLSLAQVQTPSATLAPASSASQPASTGPASLTTSTQPALTGFQLPTSIASTAGAALTTNTTTSSAVAPSTLQSINFSQMEECINKWSLELEDSEKVFINQATQINAWDKLLIANGDKIVELNEMLQNVRAEQQSLDHEMDFVIGQQRELEELLIPLEKELGNVTITDPDREQTYQLTDIVDTQLKQMSEDLKEIIEHLNESNRSDDNNDPIVQIGRILNAHMSSMQWIDSSTAQISSKLEQLSAMHNIVRRDNERSFYLTYN